MCAACCNLHSALQWALKHTGVRLGCRYHYNVSMDRLNTHVAKGYAENLHITSVAACGNLWAVIMDAGTRFTAQVGPAPVLGAKPPVLYHDKWQRRCWLSFGPEFLMIIQ